MLPVPSRIFGCLGRVAAVLLRLLMIGDVAVLMAEQAIPAAPTASDLDIPGLDLRSLLRCRRLLR